MMRRLRMLVGAGSAIFVLSTCGDSGPEPIAQEEAGWVTVTLATNETDAGGVLMTIRGGPIDSVRSAYPHVFIKEVGPLQKVAVVGNIVAGPIAEIFVADLSLASTYTATVDQVAARTLEQRDPADYTVTVGGQ